MHVYEHELLRGEWNLRLAELCCYELLESAARMVKLDCYFFRQ